ncbi:hypothetical protein MKEN_00387400 [Mycena kentingensis (nom. inval.)]|nr:hypothetical protein MKEN_00387400 [Mycena kentingensis (nom. inval.)]
MTNFPQLLAFVKLLGACRNPNCSLGCGVFWAGVPDHQASMFVLMQVPITRLATLTRHVPQLAPASQADRLQQAASNVDPMAGTTTAGSVPDVASFGGGADPEPIYGARTASVNSSASGSNAKKNPLQGQTAAPSTIFRDMLKDSKRHKPAEKYYQDLQAALPGAKKNTSAAQSYPSTTFDMVFVPETAMVHAEGRRRPTVDQLITLEIGGHIRRVPLNEGQTPQQIENIIRDKFRNIPLVEVFGFQLCRMKTATGGSAGRIVPLDLELNHRAVLVASANTQVRGASASWRNIVYISLPEHAPDLILPGSEDAPIVIDSDTSEHSKGKKPASKKWSPRRRRGSKKRKASVISSDEESQPRRKQPKAKAPTSGSDSDAPAHAWSAKGAGKRRAAEIVSSSDEDTPKAPPKAGSKKRTGSAAPQQGQHKAEDKPSQVCRTCIHTKAETQEKGASIEKGAQVSSDSDTSLPDVPELSARAKGKQKAKGQTAFEAGDYDDDFAATTDDEGTKDVPKKTAKESASTAGPSSSASALPLYPDAHVRLMRLLHNVSEGVAIVGRPAFYAESPRGVFAGAIRNGVHVSSVCELLIAPTGPGIISAANAPQFIVDNLLPVFEDLRAVVLRLSPNPARLGTTAVEQEFDKRFFLGAGGIHGFMPHLNIAYRALSSLAGRADIDAAYNALDSLSSVLAAAVEHLRFRYSRGTWDPVGGLRDFGLFRDAHDGDLPRTTEAEYEALGLGLLITSVSRLNVEEARIQIIQTFGDCADSKRMVKDRIIRGGEHGIGRVYDEVVVPFLDDLDTNNAAYAEMLELLEKLFEAIVRILKNHQKTASKKAPPSRAGAQASSSNTRSTRSQSRNKNGGISETEDDDSDWKPSNGAQGSQPQASGSGKRPRPADDTESDDEGVNAAFEARAREWEEQQRKRRARQNASRPKPRPKAKAPNQSRARPAWMDSTSRPEDDLEDAAAILQRARYWEDVLKYIIERFPHPDASRRVTLQAILEADLTRSQQYRRLSLVYHPDRNTGQDAHFLAVAEFITKALNNARVSKA